MFVSLGFSPVCSRMRSPGAAVSIKSAELEEYSLVRDVDVPMSNNQEGSLSVLSRHSIQAPNATHDPNSNALSRANSIVGTLEYMAPEVIILFGKRKLHKDGYSGAVDFWSLGIMIYKLLTGVEPFPRFTYDTLRSILPAHLSRYTGYHDAFDALFGTVNYDICDGILTPNTRLVLQGLLEFHEDCRLGYRVDNIEAAHEELKNHPFFASIDWSLLESKQLPPPYIPHDEVLENMRNDPCEVKSLCQLLREANKNQWCEEFEPPRSGSGVSSSDSPKKTLSIRDPDQYYFRSWNYANPNVISE